MELLHIIKKIIKVTFWITKKNFNIDNVNVLMFVINVNKMTFLKYPICS